MLFILGGNGTHAGAQAIHDEVPKYINMIFGIPNLLLLL
jgi:6-phosphofructokinase